MTFDSRYTWEKLVLELKLLRNEDFGALLPLSIGINSAIWPKENMETCLRQIQFLGFEIQKACEGLEEAERWETLRRFIFEDKGFQLTSTQLLMPAVFEQRSGHPLTIVFLLLHLAHFLDLPIALIHARHHFLLKWVRSGRTFYLDLYNEGRALNDAELIQVLNRSSATLEVWNASQLIRQYLDLLTQNLQVQQDLAKLHQAYNLILQLDETNSAVLGQRALLRHKLGYAREALADLKRYFSFNEKSHAPIELQQAWLDLETTPPPPEIKKPDLLH